MSEKGFVLQTPTKDNSLQVYETYNFIRRFTTVIKLDQITERPSSLGILTLRLTLGESTPAIFPSTLFH